MRLRARTLAKLFVVSALALGLVACGQKPDPGAETRANLIRPDPGNRAVRITVGSKNFTEQFILGEIYAQALRAAGYRVEKRLDLGSEKVALRALQSGEIDAYPEYTSTALTSLFGIPSEQVPASAGKAYRQLRADFARRGLTAFPPTPFSSANAVGMLTERAEALGVDSVSDLEGRSDFLTLAGSPECRLRRDCLVGLRKDYGLRFGRFTPTGIARRYDVLDRKQADLSILFTTDAQLAVSDNYVILRDDRRGLPAGNVLFVVRQATAKRAGPDLARVVGSVQRNLTQEEMQKLNARVEIDGQTPARAAQTYLKEFGYVR